jgi:AcrR family transcriptional regulator
MPFQLQIKMNDKLFIRDPELSELGRKIISQSVHLINKNGFEAFTFKKLALEIGTAEASIYRYFENKHRLLTYLTAWYWSWLEFRVVYHTNNLLNPQVKLKKVIALLIVTDQEDFGSYYMPVKTLHEIIIAEGSKSYLTSHVSEDNKAQFFKPYKDLCALFSQIILENNPGYKYARSLSSTIIEMAHFQYFFMKNLPSLTDFPANSDPKLIIPFLEDLVLGSIKKK